MSTYLVYVRATRTRWDLCGAALSEPPAETIRRTLAAQNPTRPTAVIEDRTGTTPPTLAGALISSIAGGGSSCHPPLERPADWTWRS